VFFHCYSQFSLLVWLLKNLRKDLINKLVWFFIFEPNSFFSLFPIVKRTHSSYHLTTIQLRGLQLRNFSWLIPLLYGFVQSEIISIFYNRDSSSWGVEPRPGGGVGVGLCSWKILRPTCSTCISPVVNFIDVKRTRFSYKILAPSWT